MAWTGDELDPLAGSSEALARFEEQLRDYERDKLACRLKLCCLLQLVRQPPEPSRLTGDRSRGAAQLDRLGSRDRSWGAAGMHSRRRSTLATASASCAPSPPSRTSACSSLSTPTRPSASTSRASGSASP